MPVLLINVHLSKFADENNIHKSKIMTWTVIYDLTNDTILNLIAFKHELMSVNCEFVQC